MVRYDRYFGHALNGWDAQFYYAQSRALFFGHTFDITSYLRETPWTPPFQHPGEAPFSAVPRNQRGELQSKYPLGLPLVETIFLGLAHGARLTLHACGVRFSDPPGLSEFEIGCVALGLFSLTFIALMRLGALCFGEYPSPARTVLAVLGAYFGTTLYFYSAAFPFMSHGLGFAASVFWIAELKSLPERRGFNLAYIRLGFLAALIFLIRPQQILLPLFSLPFLWKPMLRRPGLWLPGAVIGFLASLGAVALTLAYNKHQFGVYTLNSYGQRGEGFDFFHPQLGYVLFGGERGLFFYAPILFLALPGLIDSLRRGRCPWLWPAMVNGACQIYLVASWWTPKQGDSFGMRMWTENVFLVAFGLCAAPLPARKSWKYAFYALVMACCAWTVYRTFHYLAWT